MLWDSQVLLGWAMDVGGLTVGDTGTVLFFYWFVRLCQPHQMCACCERLTL